MSRRRVHVVYGRPQTMVIRVKRPYTFGLFLFDLFMTVITSGFWLIWVAIRALFF